MYTEFRAFHKKRGAAPNGAASFDRALCLHSRAAQSYRRSTGILNYFAAPAARFVFAFGVGVAAPAAAAFMVFGFAVDLPAAVDFCDFLGVAITEE